MQISVHLLSLKKAPKPGKWRCPVLYTWAVGICVYGCTAVKQVVSINGAVLSVVDLCICCSECL